MKTYKLLTKPYKIKLVVPKHKMKHQLMEDRWIDFNLGTEMWCCKVECGDHALGVSLMVFNHSWMTTFRLDSSTLKTKWQVNQYQSHHWKSSLKILLESYKDVLSIPNFSY